MPFTSLHWSQTLNCWNGCWICKSLDFAEIFFVWVPMVPGVPEEKEQWVMERFVVREICQVGQWGCSFDLDWFFQVSTSFCWNQLQTDHLQVILFNWLWFADLKIRRCALNFMLMKNAKADIHVECTYVAFECLGSYTGWSLWWGDPPWICVEPSPRTRMFYFSFGPSK